MIIKKFEKQVEKYGEKIAVKTDRGEFTYLLINRLSNQIARTILETDLSLPPGEEKQMVALLFEHGLGMIISLLGGLKADKTYVPLDVSFPEKRLMYMLEDSSSYLILTNSENLAIAEKINRNDYRIEIINIDHIDITISSTNVKREPNGDRLAYLLYTSGSTGQPKGVMQNNRNVLFFVENLIKYCSISCCDRMTLLSTFSHDAAVVDIFGALFSGAALYPFDVRKKSSFSELFIWLKREKISVWHSVPTLYRYFLNTLKKGDRLAAIRYVLLGGEQVINRDIQFFKEFFPNSTLVNIYGQTESSINSLWSVNQYASSEKIVIGEPLDNTEILITDDEGQIIDDIGVGEIWIASEFLALGYWGDVDKTKLVFRYDPSMGRLYRTGDTGRLMSDGRIEFIGRKDCQVKIRGCRVELGEIESTLMQYDGIEEAVVMVKENVRKVNTYRSDDTNIENSLCAYVVAEENLDLSKLKKYLFQELPLYMVPYHFIRLEKMPVTATNKIDRQALLSLMSEEIYGDVTTGTEEVQTEVEKKISSIWQEVLKIDRIGKNDNFFDIGGNSFHFVELNSKLKREFKRDVPIVEMFTYPTIYSLARYLTGSESGENFSESEEEWFTDVQKGKKNLISQREKRMERDQYG